MKTLYTITIVFFILQTTTATAGDYFSDKAKPKWKTIFTLDSKTTVKSRFKLNDAHKSLVKNVYKKIRRKFFKYMHINKSMCENGKLNIRIVSESDLDSRAYFTGEDTFAKSKNIIFGRYFSNSRVLYVVPPYMSEYYWYSNFTHEMLHHLYYDCGIRFLNSDIEHKHIDRFIKAHKTLNR